MSNYKAKAKDSFQTKWELYVFQSIINDDSLSDEKFTNFVISDQLVEAYRAEFWQQEGHFQINGKSIKEIEDSLVSLRRSVGFLDLKEKLEKRYLEYDFVEIFSKDRFEELTKQNNCVYCDISKDEIKQLTDSKQIFKKNHRGKTLELERKNTSFEYTFDNCVMTCYWCKTAKGDEFSHEEFQELAASIRRVWDNRKKS